MELVKNTRGVEEAIEWSDFLREGLGLKSGIRKEVFIDLIRKLEEEEIRYAIGGAVALALWTQNLRATKDIYIFVLDEDIAKVMKMFKDKYLGGSGAIAKFMFGDMLARFIRAKEGFERDIVFSAEEKEVFGIKARFIGLKNYVTAKLISAFEREDNIKADQDKIDLRSITKDNAEKITPERHKVYHQRKKFRSPRISPKKKRNSEKDVNFYLML
jgi:hypothetical protein